MWDEITYPFPNFNGGVVEVWGWVSNFILHFIMDVITSLQNLRTADPDPQNLGLSSKLSFFVNYKFWQNGASVRQVSDLILKTELLVYAKIEVNLSPPSATYMRQWIQSALVQIMTFHVFGIKPLSIPVLGYLLSVEPLGMIWISVRF